MESWRLVWRQGFAPALPTAGLELLEAALVNDDPRLTQGSTTTPPPLQCVEDWPCEAADAIGTCGVPDAGGWGRAMVGQVEEFFARACFDCDQRMGEPAACRWFLNWFDETPRGSMRNQLLAEVQRQLNDRAWFATVRIPEPFVKACNDDPYNATLMGAVADWLDEHDEPRRAEVFRLRMRRLEATPA